MELLTAVVINLTTKTNEMKELCEIITYSSSKNNCRFEQKPRSRGKFGWGVSVLLLKYSTSETVHAERVKVWRSSLLQRDETLFSRSCNPSRAHIYWNNTIQIPSERYLGFKGHFKVLALNTIVRSPNMISHERLLFLQPLDGTTKFMTRGC